ncbi:hypothetical protein [Nostoc sp. FACHB-888]|uniref:hypothetical protein n=1 Tax=Nostoc sp. FACHB-888 TaxID=2692842 RepID=UPI001F556127|nr:hypothetical protein [Nostoc sp. FACHB-888]
MIAHLYGLTENEFSYILTTFPIVNATVKEAALSAYRTFAPMFALISRSYTEHENEEY